MRIAQSLLLLAAVQFGGVTISAASAKCKADGSVSIEHLSVDSMRSAEREFTLARFRIENKSGHSLRLPMSDGDMPSLVHGRYVMLEKKTHDSSEDWMAYSRTMTSFFRPKVWLEIGSGASAAFFVSVADPLNGSGPVNTMDFRIRIEDVSGCKFFSKPFGLKKDDRAE
jgi:hypothetical protein